MSELEKAIQQQSDVVRMNIDLGLHGRTEKEEAVMLFRIARMTPEYCGRWADVDDLAKDSARWERRERARLAGVR